MWMAVLTTNTHLQLAVWPQTRHRSRFYRSALRFTKSEGYPSSRVGGKSSPPGSTPLLCQCSLCAKITDGCLFRSCDFNGYCVTYFSRLFMPWLFLFLFSSAFACLYTWQHLGEMQLGEKNALWFRFTERYISWHTEFL